MTIHPRLHHTRHLSKGSEVSGYALTQKAISNRDSRWPGKLKIKIKVVLCCDRVWKKQSQIYLLKYRARWLFKSESEAFHWCVLELESRRDGSGSEAQPRLYSRCLKFETWHARRPAISGNQTRGNIPLASRLGVWWWDSIRMFIRIVFYQVAWLVVNVVWKLLIVARSGVFKSWVKEEKMKAKLQQHENVKGRSWGFLFTKSAREWPTPPL